MPIGLSGDCLQLQTILQGSQSVQSIVQSLIFFDRIVARGKKFSCSRYDRLFGIGDSCWHAILVGLEQGSGVKLAPT